MDTDKLIGKSEEEAIKIIFTAGYNHRVVHRDGEDFIRTLAFHTGRVNLSIKEGKVTAADIG
jgi:hypothetical protein